MSTEPLRLALIVTADGRVARSEIMATDKSVDHFTQALNHNAGQAGRATRQVGKYGREARSTSRDTGQLTQQVSLQSRAYSALSRALGALGLGFVARRILQTADQQAILNTRIQTATRLTGDYVAINNELYAITQRNGAGLTASVELYQRLARSQTDLQATNSEMLTLVDLVQQLGVIGGSTNDQMKHGLMQFSQMLSGGVARAEEMNSLLENLPEVATRIAAGMGKTAGELRRAVVNGEILSKDVFDSLLKQAPEIAAQFETMPDAMSRGEQRIRTAVAKMIGDLNELHGVTEGLGETFTGIAESLDELDRAAASEGLEKTLNILLGFAAARTLPPLLMATAGGATAMMAAFRGSTMVMTAHGQLVLRNTAALWGLNRAATAARATMAFLGGPLGVAILAGTALAQFAYEAESAEEKAERLAQEIKTLTGEFQSLGVEATVAQIATLTTELDAVLAKRQALGRPLGRPAMAEHIRESAALAAQIEALQTRLTAARKAMTALTGAEVVGAGSAKKLSEQQQDLLDTLFPLEKATREYAGDLTLLDDIYDNDRSGDYQRALEALKEEYEDLFPAIKKRLAAEKDQEQQTKRNLKADAKLIAAQAVEYAMLGESARARAIDTATRKLSTQATAEQVAKFAEMAAALYDAEQAQVASAAVAEQWAEVWENAARRIDDSFADLFRSGLEGMDNFKDQLVDTAKDLVAEMAYTLAKQQLIVNIGVNATGSGGIAGAAGAGGAATTLLGLPVLGGSSALLSFASIKEFFGIGTAGTAASGATTTMGTMTGAGGTFPLTAPSPVLPGAGATTPGSVMTSQFASAALAVAAAYGGNKLGESIWSQKSGSGFGAAGAGLIAASLATGPLAPLIIAAAAFAGALADVGLGKSGSENITFGLSAGTTPGDDLTGVFQAASGLALSGIGRRVDHGEVNAWIKGILSIDALFTEGLSGLGFDVDLTGKKLAGQSFAKGYQFGPENAVFGIDSETAHLKDADIGKLLDDATSQYLQALIDTTVELGQVDGELAEQLQGISGTAEDVVAQLIEIFSFEEVKANFDALFLTEDQHAFKQYADQHKALSTWWEEQTHTTLPRTLAGLQAYGEALDLADASNRDFIVSFSALVPELRTLYEQGKAFADDLAKTQAARNNVAGLFGSETEVTDAAAQAQLDALSAWFHTFTGEALPETLVGLQEYVQGLDTANQATHAFIDGLIERAPHLRDLYDESLTMPDWASSWVQDIVNLYSASVGDLKDWRRTTEKLVRAQHAAADTLINAYQSLRISGLSPLSNTERLSTAEADYQRLLAQVGAGDNSAAGDLANAARAYLTEANQYYASSDPYVSIFGEVTDTLKQLGLDLKDNSTLEDALSELEKTFGGRLADLQTEAETQVTNLIGILGGVESVEDLLETLPADIARALAPLMGDNSDASSSSGSGSGRGDSAFSILSQLYTRGLNRAPDQPGFEYWASRLEGGESIDRVIDQFMAAARANGETYTPFASGGIVTQPTLGWLGEAGRREGVLPLDGNAVRLHGVAEMVEHQATLVDVVETAVDQITLRLTRSEQMMTALEHEISRLALAGRVR